MTEPDYEPDDTTDDSDDRTVTLKRSQIKAMERDAKEARTAREQNAQLMRENTLYKSGLGTLTERQQKALFASIDGDVTAETARAAAEELGFVQAAAGDSPQDGERQQMEQMAQGAAGSSDPSSEDAIARLDRAEREGGLDGIMAHLRAEGSVR